MITLTKKILGKEYETAFLILDRMSMDISFSNL
jgi:hypothetical protein